MLHLIYRSYGGENRKGRPDFYSKQVALASFVRSFRALEPGQAEVVFLNDGPIPADLHALIPCGSSVNEGGPRGQRGEFYLLKLSATETVRRMPTLARLWKLG